jgi:hypothetical protein
LCDICSTGFIIQITTLLFCETAFDKVKTP